jgi:hypothetical protein
MDKKQIGNLIAQWYRDSKTFKRRVAIAIIWLKHKVGFKVTHNELQALPAD